MNTYEFVKDVPAEQIANIFKNFFEQHMFAYDLLKGITFAGISAIDTNTASIVYSVKLLDDENKDKLIKHLTSKAASLIIYGKRYIPELSTEGDMLYITIKK